MLPFFPPPAALMVARAVNLLLDREPWARERLARHAGKTVRVALGGWMLSLTVGEGGRLMQAAQAALPDVTLTLVPERIDPARLLRGPAADDQALTDMTHIAGDASLAQVVADLARQLRPDPEEELARLIGDVPAVRLMGGLRALGAGLRGTVRSMAGNVAEYLSEETPVLVGQPMLLAWRADLAQTSARLDASAARLANVEARLHRLNAARG